MNRVCLVGRLTAKPELKYTSSNIAVTRFSIAVNRTFASKDGQREADFINVTVWRKQAENVCKYLNKGSQASIEGRIQTGSYDGQDGKKVYTFEVIADQVQFLGTKGGNASAQPTTSTTSSTPYDFQETKKTVNVNNDPFTEFGDSVSIDDNFLD
jgi:single-strand DNA-binding protein